MTEGRSRQSRLDLANANRLCIPPTVIYQAGIGVRMERDNDITFHEEHKVQVYLQVHQFAFLWLVT